MNVPFYRIMMPDDTKLKINEYTDLSKAFKKAGYESDMLFVDSATSAMEVMALSLGIGIGDEVILPSFTYAATANAFAKSGAKLVFVDIEDRTLNIDPKAVERAITPRTKAIVTIHYGGVSADIQSLLKIAKDNGIHLLEDAAHCIGAKYNGKHLGTLGTMGCLSFHRTKNITSGGGGGSLLVNDARYLEKATMAINQGTNKDAFLKGNVDAYTWNMLGGEYSMHPSSEQILYRNVKLLNEVTESRKKIWQEYSSRLSELEKQGHISLCKPYDEHGINGHIFYILLGDPQTRDRLSEYLKVQGIEALVHYTSLHDTLIGMQVGTNKGDMQNTFKASNTLLRLPIFFGMTKKQKDYVIDRLYKFFGE